MPAVCVVSARDTTLGLIMDVKKPVTAEEQHRQKLLEYLATKGKLKLQNNSKPYLGDTTNKKPLSQSSKSVPVSKQKENALSKNPSLGFQGQKAKRGSQLSIQQQSRVAPPKVPVRNNPQVTKPTKRTTQPDGAIPSADIQHGRGLHQQKGKGLWKRQAVSKVPSCSLTQNCVNELEGGSETNKGLSDVEAKDNSCSVKSDTVSKETCSSLSCGGDQTGTSKVKQTNLHGQRKVQTASSATHGKLQKSTTSTLRNRSTTQSNITQASSLNALKAAPSASKTQNPVKNCPVKVSSSAKASTASKASQPAPQTTVRMRGSYKVVPSRTDSWRPKSTPYIGKDSGVSTMILHDRRNPLKGLKTDLITEPKQSKFTTVTKNAPGQHTIRSISKICQSKDNYNGLNKTTKLPIGKSVCSNAPPRTQKTSGDKPWLTQRGYTVSLNNKHSQNRKTGSAVTNCLISSAQTKSSNMKENVTCKQHTTPKTAAEDRRRKLEEWLSSKGKTYKRPSMTVPSKINRKVKKHDLHNCSLWDGMEEEEEMLLLSDRVNSTLSECLKLILQGAPSEDMHATLDKIPQAKRFARFWMCKARLLERQGVFDVIGLYEEAVKSGALPIDELRDTIFDIMKSTNKKPKVVRFEPLPIKEPVLEYEHLGGEHTACPNVKLSRVSTPFKALATSKHGSAVKLQVASFSSKKKEPGSQEWKFLTPVRRSLRISQSMSRYPETLKEHDTVVASLTELLDTADTETYLYTRNEALPDEMNTHLLGVIKQDQSEQKEGPV